MTKIFRSKVDHSFDIALISFLAPYHRASYIVTQFICYINHKFSFFLFTEIYSCNKNEVTL